MADLSQLFAPPVAAPKNMGNFGAAAPFAAEFTRRMALNEARELGLSPTQGDEFYKFMGERLFLLGDAEGALMINQERMENQREQAEFAHEVNKDNATLKINAFNADSSRMNARAAQQNADTRLSKEERIAGYSGTMEEINGKHVFVKTDPEGNIVDVKGLSGSSNSVTINPDGSINKTELSKPSVTDMQGKIDTHEVMLQQLEGIEQAFDPELLTYFGKGEAAFANIMDGLGMSSDAQKELITKSTNLATRTFDMFNAYLNMMSGAAITVQEAQRLAFRLPDFGTKWWKGDGPTKFFAKIQEGKRLARLGVARYNYLLNRGRIGELQAAMGNKEAKHGVIPLEAMESIVNARVKELNKQGLPPAEARAVIKQEFGI